MKMGESARVRGATKLDGIHVADAIYSFIDGVRARCVENI